MRIIERLLELDQLRVREGGPISALLPARIMIQSGQGCAAVVLGKVASMVLLVVVIVAAVI